MSKARDTADLNNGIDVDASNNVGIGTSSPMVALNVHDSTNARIALTNSSTGQTFPDGFELLATGLDAYVQNRSNGNMIFATNNAEHMRLDSAGNLLVSATTTSGFQSSSSESGTIAYAAGGIASNSPSNDVAGVFNRLGTDGIIVQLKKDGSTVGIIGCNGGYIYVGKDDVNLRFHAGANAVLPTNSGGSSRDNAIDMGSSGARFDDIYATNGTIQTSDRNEKQDIEALSDAEQRVAVACKGLLRKFRWIDAVAEKGDDARIHFGIIAQDLQDAFAAEGLDAGRYAMFISSTWWETQTEVPAVDAVAEVLDEDGNVVTEAVEAKEAYTRTDTYETLEEAPEGATERTRLGVRYPELLAFIIGAM
jgi:hypothetical protein